MDFAPPARSGWYALSTAFVWTLIASGCSSAPSGESFDDRIEDVGKLALEVEGDWDDLDAAINSGLDDGEVAIVRAEIMGDRFTQLSPWFRVYELRSITDAEGTLYIARDWTQPPNDQGSVTIVIRAQIEGEGLDGYANRLERAIARRLAQLAGVGTAPMFE